jgi:hypothetical protein
MFYYFLSAILFVLVSFKVGVSFPRIRYSPWSTYMGPAIVFFYLTYLSDVFFWFYYRKNAHLNKNIRNGIMLALRVGIAILVFFAY